ncbi:hypothetical protein [Adonisia turfae]|uniref:Uncharacterized protein n=1 Tax=Adonisia turfae CCMR0081 TaxID=2292702 RepID=A0A6M0RWR3_9CYAN|nr:hypothetical protein [Adonisia turfae]NEZ60132.1 hypothetical protein [Adonisia turfae CCMR0081]
MSTQPNTVENSQASKNVHKSSKNWFQDIPLKKIGTFVGSLAAIGSLVGVFFAVNKWIEERPSIEIEISQIDLVGYLPEDRKQILREKTIVILSNLESEYAELTGNYVNNIIRDAYGLFLNANKVFVEYPEANSEPQNYLEILQNSFSDNIEQLKSLQEKASDESKPKYDKLISAIEEEQKIIEDLELPLKISTTVRAENSSRLSNYMNSQAILLLHRNEEEYSSVPKVILDLVEDPSEDSPNNGKVEGYGVSSLTFESEIDKLEKDSQHSVDIAFKKRPEGDEDYTLIFVLEDIKERLWHEQALFSVFTEQNKKNELRASAKKVFEARE